MNFTGRVDSNQGFLVAFSLYIIRPAHNVDRGSTRGTLFASFGKGHVVMLAQGPQFFDTKSLAADRSVRGRDMSEETRWRSRQLCNLRVNDIGVHAAVHASDNPFFNFHAGV